MAQNPFLQKLISRSDRPPFDLELRYQDLQPDGRFTPSAAVLVTPSLAESGLLRLLSPEEMQTLMLVLSSVTANGTFVASSETLAPILGIWTGQMRSRLERLVRRDWNGEPMLRCYTTETGLRLFSPSPHLFAVRRSQVTPAPDNPGTPLEMPAPWRPEEAVARGGFRETVIAHSREQYGRPRAEVEAEINRFLGYEGKGDDEPATPEEAARHYLERRLIEAGLTAYQARSLVDSFPEDRIEAQLRYLPYRNARYPAGMLIAAVEGDYAAPLAARVEPVNEPINAATEDPESPEAPMTELGITTESPEVGPVPDVTGLETNHGLDLLLPPDSPEAESQAQEQPVQEQAAKRGYHE